MLTDKLGDTLRSILSHRSSSKHGVKPDLGSRQTLVVPSH